MSLRSQVLNSFKLLHRTRQKVFEGDVLALEKGRLKINEEYKNKKHVTDQSAISELINFAQGVEKELRTTVIQAEEVEPGKFKLRITKDTIKMDGVPYKECCKNT